LGSSSIELKKTDTAAEGRFKYRKPIPAEDNHALQQFGKAPPVTGKKGWGSWTHVVKGIQKHYETSEVKSSLDSGTVSRSLPLTPHSLNQVTAMNTAQNFLNQF